jgi:hypothetical protein
MGEISLSDRNSFDNVISDSDENLFCLLFFQNDSIDDVSIVNSSRAKQQQNNE